MNTEKEDDDFGFSALSEQELKDELSDDQDIANKLNGLKKMIMPLLKNLMKNPDKEYIYWPDRIKKIQDFIKKIDTYIENK